MPSSRLELGSLELARHRRVVRDAFNLRSVTAISKMTARTVGKSKDTKGSLGAGEELTDHSGGRTSTTGSEGEVASG